MLAYITKFTEAFSREAICLDHSSGPVSPELAEEARHGAAEITRYQKGGSISKADGEIIVRIFTAIYAKYGIIGLEEIKNEICDERDSYDLVDLMRQVRPYHATQLAFLFTSPFALKPPGATLRGSPYAIKVISDVDNTAIEAARIAPPTYRDGDIIPGFLPLVEALSGKGATTTTFISARPRAMELESIGMMAAKIKSHAEQGGLNIRFSFETGTFMSLVGLAAAEGTGALVASARRGALLRSFRHLAELKFKNYTKIAAIYPDCRFVFFGDDTQGDAVFAKTLVDRDPRAVAVIRHVAEGRPIAPCDEHLRIVYHTSYYEAACKLADPALGFPGDLAPRAAVSMDRERAACPSSANALQAARDEMFLNALQTPKETRY